MAYINSLLVIAALAGGGEAVTSPEKSNTSVPATPGIRCKTPKEPKFIIINTKKSQFAVEKTQVLGNKSQDLSFDHIVDIRGKGAGCIRGLTFDFLLMEGGNVYLIGSKGELVRRDVGMSPYATQAEQTGPVLGGKAPGSVAALSSSPYNHGRVGLWFGHGRSTVALFEAGPSVKSELRVVGTSAIRFRDVGYAPAPDAPTGSITLIRDITPDHIEVWVGELRTGPFVH